MKPVKQAAAAMAGVLSGAIDFALPPLCLSCRKPVASDGGLCGPCWRDLRLIERPYCEVLGTPFAYDIGPGAVSADAIADPPAFDRARAAVVYSGVARDLVHRLKYADKGDLARWMGAWMIRAGADLLAEADLIAPVPLHRRRLWSRRFNQAAHLAHAVGRSADVAVQSQCLERVRATRQQVGLSAADRSKNVRGAFRVRHDPANPIRGRRVLLVDDVLTTGATLDACARALCRGGAEGVDVLVFARVVPGQEGAI